MNAKRSSIFRRRVLAAYKLAERKFEDDSDALYERLVSIFQKPNVARHAEMVGSSSTKWPISNLIKFPSSARRTVFEPVTKHHASVYSTSTKFHDLALLSDAPGRVAVVHKKSEFGPWLGLLSQAANVIDADVPNSVFERIAEAA